MIYRRRFVWFHQLLVLASLTMLVDSMPYLLLKNKAPKCSQIDAPSHVTLIISYHAPDMVIVTDDIPERKEDGKNEHNIDSRFNERFLKRMESLKRARIKDINFSITPRDASGMMITPRMMTQDNHSMDEEEDERAPTKQREQLDEKEGSFKYETGDLQGTLEICVQSYTATAESPSRVAFTVKVESDYESVTKKLEAERKLMAEKLEVENKVVKDETSRITAELVRMFRRAQTIAGDAQFSKQREEVFHSQSISLNQAVKYWPIIRMIVILIGGYFQVTHVINYMKSRHIY